MSMRGRLSNLSLLNYIFIAVMFLWSSLQSFTAFDGAGRIPIILTFIVFIGNLGQRIDFLRPPFLYHVFWFLYVIILYFIFGLEEDSLPFYFFAGIFECVVLSYVAYKEFLKDGERVLNYIIWILSIRTLIILTSGSLNEDSGRMHFFGGNGFALTMVPFSFIAFLKFIRKEMRLPILLALLSVIIYVPVVCATRKAFAGIAIVLVFVILSYLDFRSIKSFGAILLMVMAILGGRFLLNNSVLGERFENESVAGKSLVKEENFFTDFVGDRTDQYVLGWRLFQEHPFTGVGLNNFSRVTGYPYQLHTEYMVQFAECGIIGVFFFFLYYTKLFRSAIYVYRKRERHVGALMIGFICAELFICFTAWMYVSGPMFVCYGIIMGVYQTCKIKGA